MQPVFRNGHNPLFPDVSAKSPVSVDLWNRGLYLPSGLGLTKAHMEEVTAKLIECHA